MKFLKLLLVAITLVLSSSVNAALVERLGGLAYYDTEANLTWLTDASSSTLMTWADANAWAAGLNVAGVTGWRLPDTLEPDSSCSIHPPENGSPYGYGCTGSEMGNMYYNVLGGVAGTLLSTTHNSNYDLFTGLPVGNWWSATLVTDPNWTDYAWDFSFTAGYQRYVVAVGDFPLSRNAWAVHTGDVSAVPVPAAVWLFSSGLIGLFGLAKRKKA